MKKMTPTLVVVGVASLALSACDDALVSLEDAAAAAALTNGSDSGIDTGSDTEDGAGPRAPSHRPPPPPLDCAMVAFEDSVLDEYDTDGDGALSSEEHTGLAADFEGDEPPADGMGPPPPPAGDDRPPPPFGRAGHGRRALEFLVWVYDADADAALSEEERTQMNADLVAGCEARKDRMLEELDTDSDGALSDAELEAGFQARHAEMLEELDTDGDGAVSRAEHEAARAAHEAAREAERASFDEDGDGALNGDEERALKAAIQEHIRNGDAPPPPAPPPPM